MFNDFIALDGKKYRTTHKSWTPQPTVPSTARLMLDGTLDSTFSEGEIMQWAGEIVGPVTPKDGTWGTIEDLRVSLKKRQRLTLTDHYGNDYSAHIEGPFKERSLMPDWTAGDNKIYVSVKIKAQAA